MKHYLQGISYTLALLTVLAACDKEKTANTASNSSSQSSLSQVPLNPCYTGPRTKISARLTPVGKLSQARTEIAVVSVGNKILFAGGNKTKDGSLGSSRVDIYDIASQSWSTAELSTARSSMGAVVSNGKVFFAGGSLFDGQKNYFKAFDTVDVYNAADNTWSVARLSEPRGSITAAAVGDKVLFAGGIANERGVTPATVDIYDLTTASWSIAQLREGKCYMSAVTLNNKIYFAGGSVFDWGGWGPSSLMEIYNYENNTWSIDSLKQPLEYATGVAIANRIFWASKCYVEINDLHTGSNSRVNLFLPGHWFGVNGQNAAVSNNKIIFFRHRADEHPAYFDIYDLSTNELSLGQVPTAIDGVSIISVNNTIYLAGGSINGTLSDQVWKLEF